MNFEEALDYSDDYMEDWNQFYYGVAARGFYNWDKPIQVVLSWHDSGYIMPII